MTGQCPACGHRPARTPETRLRRQLAGLTGEWTMIRSGASRYLVHKFRKAYPEVEWRAERISMLGGRDGAWLIEARRPQVLEPAT